MKGPARERAPSPRSNSWTGSRRGAGRKDPGMHERCHLCNKKAGTVPFRCKCGHVFCAKHRHPEDHACTYDHKGEGKADLAAKNPKVVSPKVVAV